MMTNKTLRKKSKTFGSSARLQKVQSPTESGSNGQEIENKICYNHLKSSIVTTPSILDLNQCPQASTACNQMSCCHQNQYHQQHPAPYQIIRYHNFLQHPEPVNVNSVNITREQVKDITVHTSVNTSNLGDLAQNNTNARDNVEVGQPQSMPLSSIYQLPEDDKELTFIQFLKHIQIFVQRDYTSSDTVSNQSSPKAITVGISGPITHRQQRNHLMKNLDWLRSQYDNFVKKK